jgi:hypothetical protein
MLSKFNSEPVRVAAIVLALVNLIVAIAAGFNYTVSDDQARVAVSVLIFLAGEFVRNRVTPVAPAAPAAPAPPAPPTA